MSHIPALRSARILNPIVHSDTTERRFGPPLSERFVAEAFVKKHPEEMFYSEEEQNLPLFSLAVVKMSSVRVQSRGHGSIVATHSTCSKRPTVGFSSHPPFGLQPSKFKGATGKHRSPKQAIRCGIDHGRMYANFKGFVRGRWYKLANLP